MLLNPIEAYMRWLVESLERISQIPQKNDAAAEIKHPEKVLGVPFISDHEPAKVLQPGKQSFNFPAAAITSQASQILRSIFAVAAVRGDQFYPIAPKSDV